MVLFFAFLACVDVTGTPGRQPGAADPGSGASGSGNEPPVIREVTITPASPRLDQTVTCEATATDPDDDKVTVEYAWKLKGSGGTLGNGRTLTLDPRSVSTEDSVVCTATATDRHGASASGSTNVTPRCGFSDVASLRSVDLDIDIVFQPFITDDVEPGYGSEPWDWDGQIPDWIFDLADVLEELLEFVTGVYPDPDLLTALEAVQTVEDLLRIFDEVAPGLFAASVPPDPDLYPYVVDAEGGIAPFWGGVEGVRWDDSYTVSLHLDDVSFAGGRWFFLDMEDVDLAFDDNMGDYLDQGATPLILTDSLIEDTAYCTAVTYNRDAVPLESAYAYIPGSILWLSLRAD